MSRTKLKCGGKRPKALFGTDGAIMAGATLAAAAMNVAATTSAAKTQASAMKDAAKVQAQSVVDQTNNNNALQKESINFTRQQNAENRQQQQDIQMTLQMLAGQSNLNDRMEAQKMQVKYGGRPKRRKLKSTPSYGGGDKPFKVTDGGGVIPVQVDQNGYGLYELFGNDHEHYHKAPGGKNKTGVGIKFNDGSVVEGEGNQNSNQGELMYVTPDDAMFISKHSIKGFNPAKAVKAGAAPEEAFAYQEFIKDAYGIEDDGSQAKCGKRKSIRRAYGGLNVIDTVGNITQLPINTIAPIAAGAAYAINQDKTTSPVAKNGKRISIKRNGGRVKAKTGYSNLQFNYNAPNLDYNSPLDVTTTPSYNFSNSGSSSNEIWGDYGGAIMSGIGNFGSAIIGGIGNSIASGIQRKGINAATNAFVNKISEMHGIDMNEIKRDDFKAAHAMAVIRDPRVNVNPQLERIRRNAASERREINRGTLSSAARQQRLAGTNDRMYQSSGETYAYQQNAEEQIKQQNAQTLTNVINANADRDTQARQAFANQYLSALKYNAEVDNAKIGAIAQARADALSQSAGVKANSLQSTMGMFGNAINSTAGGFASTYDGLRQEQKELDQLLTGMDTDNQVHYLLQNVNGRGNTTRARNLWNAWKFSPNANQRKYAQQLASQYNFV